MDSITLRATLSLAIRLIDTTLGRIIDSAGAKFYRDGEETKPAPRGEGLFVFINQEKTDFDLRIEMPGFEVHTEAIRYDELDEREPIKDIFLIPKENYRYGENFLTLSGVSRGLTSIEAIRLDKPCVRVSGYDAKRHTVILVVTEGRYHFEVIRYGLLNSAQDKYQPFLVDEEMGEKVKLREPLEELEFEQNTTVHRVIYGQVPKKGHYLLRVRNDASYLPYLIRYVKNNEVKFQLLDLALLEKGEKLKLK